MMLGILTLAAAYLAATPGPLEAVDCWNGADCRLHDLSGTWSATIAVKKKQSECKTLDYEVTTLPIKKGKRQLLYLHLKEYCKNKPVRQPLDLTEVVINPKALQRGEQKSFTFEAPFIVNGGKMNHFMQFYKLWKSGGQVVAAAVVQTIFGDAKYTQNPIEHMYAKTLWVRRVNERTLALNPTQITELVRQIQTTGPQFAT